MKYQVQIKEIEVYLLEIETDDETEVQDLAYLKLEECEDKGVYHHDSDGEFEIVS